MTAVRETLILQLLGTVLYNKAVVGQPLNVASREAGAKCIHQSSQRDDHHCSNTIDEGQPSGFQNIARRQRIRHVQ